LKRERERKKKNLNENNEKIMKKKIFFKPE